jgi:hypothetical protein
LSIFSGSWEGHELVGGKGTAPLFLLPEESFLGMSIGFSGVASTATVSGEGAIEGVPEAHPSHGVLAVVKPNEKIICISL